MTELEDIQGYHHRRCEFYAERPGERLDEKYFMHLDIGYLLRRLEEAEYEIEQFEIAMLKGKP